MIRNIRQGIGKLGAAMGGLLLVCLAPTAQALTTAGTVVENTATANYNVGGVGASVDASVSFTVQEIIDATVSWTDGTNVLVSTPDSDQVASFDVTNTGNGNETFSLAAENVSSPTDDFDFDLISGVEIYIEDGTTPGYQETEDTLYTGANNPTIAPESTQTIYLVAAVPGALSHDDEGQLTLTVESTTAGAPGSAPGTELTGLGDGGVDAIVGTSEADAEAAATFQVSTVDVTITKEILSVLDEFGNDALIPNAEVTYRITVSVTGGTAEDLEIVDPIPANTSFKSGSIQLDAVTLTDGDDADAGDYNLTNPGAVTVELGDTPGGTTYEVDITVTID